MADNTTRSRSEKFFPVGPESLAGAQAKTQFLLESTQIAIGVPMYHQIYNLLNHAPEGGFTVTEVSKKLCINTKTCAKVLDEMVYKYKDIKVTAHRYGRIFLHKYQVKRESLNTLPEQQEEYISMVRKEALEEIDTIPADTRKAVEQALAIESSHKKRTSNRQRVTYQTVIRSLFILRKVLDQRIVSVNELKESITHELEENAKWTLDRKTVIRLITKLQNAGLVKLLVFCVSFNKAEGPKVQFLGNSFETKQIDTSGHHFIHKMIVTVPEVTETDPAVLQNPILTNTKQKKPITINKNENTPLKTRHKRLAAFIARQVKAEDADLPESEPVPEVSRTAMWASWAFDFILRLVVDRYEAFWSVVASPICPLALRLLFSREQELRSVIPQRSEKLKLAYGNVTLPKIEDTEVEELPLKTASELNIYLPKKRVKYKQPSISDAVYAIKRVLITLERTPENVSVEKDKHLNKGLDVPLQNLLEYLALVDLACLKGKSWSRTHHD